MWDTASGRLSWALRIGWILSAATCAVLMQLHPGDQAVTLHLIWLGLAVAYGFTIWRPIELAVMVVSTMAVTGTILIRQAAAGLIDWTETAEVPIGAATIVVVAWHIRRRYESQRQTQALAEHDRRRSAARQQVIQQISHELRTPITIARGYTEALREEFSEPSQLEDSAILLDELDKIGHIAQRLITFMEVEAPYLRERVGLDVELERIVRRWATAAERAWTVTASPVHVMANRGRLEAALDCLLDNAVRFTSDGNRITVRARAADRSWSLEVADEGEGMAEHDVEALNAGQQAARNARSGTGLGLIMVRAIVSSWGGNMRIASERGVGTRVTLHLPLDPDNEDRVGIAENTTRMA
jgi:signal transduction histidine kinase